MMSIYYKPHQNREKEKLFLDFLKREFPKAEHITKNYLLDVKLLQNFIEIPKVIRLLKKDTKLSSQKRNQTIAVLSTIPAEVYVARKINEVSIDFTILINNKVHFIELHEEQHSKLSGSKMTPIICSNYQRHEIPRFAQRLLKDIWRLENLPNYKIVWYDWFDQNKKIVSITDILKNEKAEFSIPDKFNLSSLCRPSRFTIGTSI